MDRWTKITTWQDFETEWARTTTEAGAIGLLYAGAKIQESGQRTDDESGIEDHSRCFAYKAEFFRSIITTVENPTIATTARRLIVNELLIEGLGLSWYGRIGPTHEQLVNFLGVVHDDLRKQPFPRKADDFLFHSFYKWRAKEREAKAPDHRKREIDVARVSRLSKEYDRTEPLVRACVAWGALPQVLVKQWFTQEMLQEIRVVAEPLLLASLGETEDLQVARVRGSLTWGMNEDPPRDIYGEEGRRELWKRNGLTVNYLRALR